MSSSDQPESSSQNTFSIPFRARNISIGALLVGLSLYNDLHLCQLKDQLLVSIACGFFFSDSKASMSVKWKSWSVAGPGVIALSFFAIIFLIHHFFEDCSFGNVQPPTPPPATAPPPATPSLSNSEPTSPPESIHGSSPQPVMSPQQEPGSNVVPETNPKQSG